MSNPLLPLVRNLSMAHQSALHSHQERRTATLGQRLTQDIVDRDNLAQATFRERLLDLFLQANIEEIKAETEIADEAQSRAEHGETMKAEGR